jgi:hypothetical protein
MRVLIPFLDEVFDLRTQVRFGFNIDTSQALPWEDAEPLCHVIPPRTMPRSAVHDKARMVGEPFVDVLAMLRPDMVAHEMNAAEGLVKLRVQCLQKGDACPLTRPFITLPIAGQNECQRRQRD